MHRNVRTNAPPTDNVPTLPVVALQVYALRLFGYENFKTLLRDSGLTDLADLPRAVTKSKSLGLLMDRLRTELGSAPALLDRVLHTLEQQKKQEAPSPNSYRALFALMKAYHGSRDYFLNLYGPPGTLPTVSYSALMEGVGQNPNQAHSDLTGKVVFVGNMELSFTEEHVSNWRRRSANRNVWFS